MKLPTHDAPVPHKIHKSYCSFQYFKGCLGALDGTHMPVLVPAGQWTAYCNRKGQLLQNVLAACDFDLRFIYVLPRWEGSTADSCVLDHARASDFVVPKGWYYLGDAGYPNSVSLLAPYWSTHYHLKEWEQGKHRYVHFSFTCSEAFSWPTCCSKVYRLQRSCLIINTPAQELHRAHIWHLQEAIPCSYVGSRVPFNCTGTTCACSHGLTQFHSNSRPFWWVQPPPWAQQHSTWRIWLWRW